MVTSPSASALLAGLEQELRLLARHHLSAAQANPRLQLDRSGYQLLARVERDPLPLSQLAAAFRVDVSTVNRQVRSLLDQQLVQRIADPAGGVALLIQPTPAGLAALHHDRRVRQEDVAAIIASWDEDDIRQLHRMLELFNTSIEALEGCPWPRS